MATKLLLTTGVVYVRSDIDLSLQTVTTARNGIAVTSTDGVILSNSTASTASVTVEQSPRIRLRSNVWNTTVTAVNNTDDWIVESVPVSGATPSGLLKFGSSLNGGAYTFPMTLTSAALLTLTNGSSTAFLLPDAANTLAQRNGTNAQTFNAYNTYTSGTNYERLEFAWSGNVAYLVTRKGSGGGSARALTIGTIDSAALTLYTSGSERWDVAAGGNFLARTDNQLDIGASGATRAKDIYIAGRYYIGGSGTATSANEFTKKVTAIADNTATDVLTVTIPNGNHAAAVNLTFVSSNGSTDAFESSRTAHGSVVVARTTGANAVATASAIADAAIATVASGATHTLAYGVSAISGAADASNTFTIQVTIDDLGNLGSNQVVVLAELINAEATGVTIA